MVSPGHGSTGGLRAAATRLCDGSLRIVPRGSREPVSHPSAAEAWGPLPRFPAPLGARRPLQDCYSPRQSGGRGTQSAGTFAHLSFAERNRDSGFRFVDGWHPLPAPPWPEPSEAFCYAEPGRRVKPRDRLAEVTQGGGTEKAGDRALSALGPGRRDSPEAGRELAGKLNRTPRLPSAAPLCLGLRSLPRSQNLAVTEAMSPTPPPTRLQTK